MAVVRSHVYVRFLKNAYDEETRESWYASPQPIELPDVVAIRQVERGNAEYVSESDVGKLEKEAKAGQPSKEEQKESKQAAKDAAPPDKARVSDNK